MTGPQSARVSVVVPAFQAEATLRDAFASLTAQTFGGWEAVVVDDGSTDRTGGIAAELAAADARVRVVRQANAGVSAARNAGLEAAAAEWVLFLDADDRLTPDALEHLLTAAGPHRDWVHGGWVRHVDGARQRVQAAYPVDDPLRTLAASCPFAIHACLVRTEAVRAVGGFDTTLRTCEDWDLWRRLAAAGHRPVPIDAVVAEYIVRGDSASMATPQLLTDGLRLIAAAHDEAKLPDPERAAAQAAFCAYVAGIAIGQGGDPAWVLARWNEPAKDTSANALADMLYAAVPLGALASAEAWPAGAATVAAVDGWLGELERVTGGLRLQRRTMARLEHRIGESLARSAEPQPLGRALLVDLDLAAPPSAVTLPAAAERVLVRAWLDGDAVSYAELLPLGGVADGRALLDAALTHAPWDALLRMMRWAGVTPGDDGEGDDWERLLQHVFGDRSVTNDAVYAGAAHGRPTVLQVEDRAEVELADGPVELRSRAPVVAVEVRLAGEPLDEFDLQPKRGRITSGRLRQQVAVRQGVELVRVALRAHVSRASAADTGADTGLVATAPATGWPLPASHQLAAVAADYAPARPATPSRPGPADAELPTPQPARRNASSFDALFASEEDPWRYESGYETRKYEQTLSLLPAATDTVLELACAEGHFTAMLAGRARRIVATDVSPLALERARARCAALGAGSGEAEGGGAAADIEFRQHDLFADAIEGRWPVIVCSEVLYYAGQVEDLVPVVRKILKALEPGGVLITAHANILVDDPSAPGFDWQEAYGSLGIQRAILATGIATLDEEIVTPMYRVQRYRRTSRLRAKLAPAARTTHADADPDLSPDVRAHFLPDGGTPSRTNDADRPALSAPVLMYHRVAPDGADHMRRWRVTPDEFEEQLAFLRESGFTSVSLDEWRDATMLGRPLPEQPVILTFDDGYDDFAEHAAPALERHGFRATNFLVSGLIGQANAWDRFRGDAIPLMDWDAIADLEARGFAFGAHTRTHQPLTWLPPTAAYDEIARSFTDLAERLRQPPVAFAYPYGDLSQGVRGLTGLAGAHLAVTCEDRIATDRDDPLLVPRIEVRGDGDPLRDLVRRLSGW